MIIKEMPLPKGDTYLVMKGTTYKFYSVVRREEETTICCHGTNSWKTIYQYYHDVHLCQKEIMEGKGITAEQHVYWKAYFTRMNATSTHAHYSHPTDTNFALKTMSCNSSKTSSTQSRAQVESQSREPVKRKRVSFEA